MLLALIFVLSSGQIFAQESSPEEKPNTEQKQSADADTESKPPAEMKTEEETKETSKPVRRKRRSYSKRSESFLSAFSSVVGSTSAAVVEVTDGDKRIAMGTVVDAAEGFVLSKASELRGDLNVRFHDGSKVKPTIVGVDPETDLVLLKVEKEGINEAIIDDEFVPEIGSWLVTVDQKEKPIAVGIVSHEPRLINSHLPNSAIIGIRPEDRIEGDGVRINVVFNDSPAEEAGLLVNDVITGIDGDTIKNREQLMEKLSNYLPGDEIVLTILRDEKESEVPVTLGKRRVSPMRDRGTQQNSMGSTLSKRRSDFPLAIQHDSALNADDCGGPVVDLTGRIIGINIARDGRVSSLALPNEVVIPVIAKLRSGKMLPAIVNKKEIASVEKELAQLEKDLEDLPEEKMEAELDFRAGTAVEDELNRQLEEMEKRLAEMKERLKSKKDSNTELGKSLARLKSKQSRLQREIKPLKSKLKKLKTGVE